jgi:hypothetical protein
MYTFHIRNVDARDGLIRHLRTTAKCGQLWYEPRQVLRRRMVAFSVCIRGSSSESPSLMSCRELPFITQ